MKSLIYRNFLIFPVLFFLVSLSVFTSAQGISRGYIQHYGSIGHDESGGIIFDNYNKIFTAVSFAENLSLVVQGKTILLKKQGRNDILITASDTNGNILSYCQIKGPGVKILRNFYRSGTKIILTGSYTKKLEFLNRNMNKILFSGNQKIAHFAVCVDTLCNLVWSTKINLDYKCTILEKYLDDDSLKITIAKRPKDAYPNKKDTSSYSPKTLSYIKINYNNHQKYIKFKDNDDVSVTHIEHYNGKIIVVGYFSDTLKINSTTMLISSGGKDIFFLLCNYNGQIQKVFSFGGIGDDVPNDLVRYRDESDLLLTFSDNLKIDSSTTIYSFGSTDVALLKINNTSNSTLVYQYGGPSADFGLTFSRTDTTDYISMKLTGSRLSFSNNGIVRSITDSVLYHNTQSDFLVIDTLRKIVKLSSGVKTKVTGLNVSDTSSVYIAGNYLFNMQTEFGNIKSKGVQDAFVLKLINPVRRKEPPVAKRQTKSDSILVHKKDSLSLVEFKGLNNSDSLLQMYPNPFRDNITFNYHGRKVEYFDVSFYDLSIKLVYSTELLADKQNAAIFDFSNGQLSPGTYLCKIIVHYTAESQDEIFIKKVVKKL